MSTRTDARMKRALEEEAPATEQPTSQELFATHFPSVRYLPASPARRLAGAAGLHCLCVEGRRDRLPVSRFLAHLQERGRVPPSGTTGTEPSPPIFECSCPVAGCPDRMAMQGPSPPPRMALLGAKGWGLCATGDIPAGAFVCEYRGEALSASEAAARHSSYELAGLQHTFLLCVRESFGARVNVTAIDATHAGSEGRCINHSCRPNLVLELVRTDQPLAPNAAPPAADGAAADAAGRPSAAQAIRACFFTQRPVAAGEEFTIDYAEGSSAVGAGEMHGVGDNETSLTGGARPGQFPGPAAGGATEARQESSHTRCLCGEDSCRRWLPRHTAPLGEWRADSAAPPTPTSHQPDLHQLCISLRLCGLWLELGFGKLRLAQLAELKHHRGARDRAESMATASSTTARNLRVAETYTDVRGEGVKKPVNGSATTEQGLRCLTSADRHVGVGMGVS